MSYTAISLLETLHDFTSMTQKSEWSFEAVKDNPPRLIRLKQINALISAFIPELEKEKTIRKRLEMVLSGNFIINRDDSVYIDLFAEMDNAIKKSRFLIKKMDALRVHDLKDNYEELLEYKLLLTKILNYNKGIMEISYPYLYPLIINEKISKMIKIEQLDRFLELIIDPYKRTYTIEELMKQFDYPTEDLFDIDLDYF